MSSNQQIYDWLINSPLTYRLEPRYIHILAGFVESKWLHKGDVLYWEDEKAESFCYVVEGRLQVLKQDVSKASKVIAYLTASRLVGIMEVLDESDRAATVKALETTHVLVITRKSLEHIEHEFPRIGQAIMRAMVRVLADHLRQADAALADMYGQRL
jgi:CRP/FNR family transcriptional regulator, cyclic AMP receptor protein